LTNVFRTNQPIVNANSVCIDAHACRAGVAGAGAAVIAVGIVNTWARVKLLVIAVAVYAEIECARVPVIRAESWKYARSGVIAGIANSTLVIVVALN